MGMLATVMKRAGDAIRAWKNLGIHTRVNLGDYHERSGRALHPSPAVRHLEKKARLASLPPVPANPYFHHRYSRNAAAQ